MKKKKNTITGLVQANVTVGLGSAITAGISGASGVNVSGGMASMGGMMPIVSTAGMGGMALDSLKGLTKIKRKKRRR